MSPWRVLFSIDACRGLMPPVPRISVRLFRSASLKCCTSIGAEDSCYERRYGAGTADNSTSHRMRSSLGAKCSERFVFQHVEARQHADDRDERSRQTDTGNMLHR